MHSLAKSLCLEEAAYCSGTVLEPTNWTARLKIIKLKPCSRLPGIADLLKKGQPIGFTNRSKICEKSFGHKDIWNNGSTQNRRTMSHLDIRKQVKYIIQYTIYWMRIHAGLEFKER